MADEEFTVGGERPQKSLTIGDLVVYTYPTKYLSKDAIVPYGIVTEVDTLFAKVVWSDGEIFLESIVDLKVVNN
tara:strand:- start:282 stop:503 length:222 start_codon:yes stop_codon:yes gene_type:complete